MAVRARRQRRLGALKLGDDPAPVEDLDRAAELLARGIAEAGIARLPWSKDQRALRERATYLANSIGAPWPDLSDVALAADTAWLTPHIAGRTQLSAITADDLRRAE